MNNKFVLLATIFFIFLSISLVSSQDEQGTQQSLKAIKQNNCMTLQQICANCSYVNITQINIPYNNTAILSSQLSTTKIDTVYNRTFCSTRDLGNYIVNWKADPDGITTTGNWDFQVTTTGFDIPVSLQFLFIGIIFSLLTLGVYKRDITITLLSTFGLYFIGIWMLFFGLNIYKNLYTEAFSFITLGTAAYLSVIMAHEYIV